MSGIEVPSFGGPNHAFRPVIAANRLCRSAYSSGDGQPRMLTPRTANFGNNTDTGTTHYSAFFPPSPLAASVSQTSIGRVPSSSGGNRCNLANGNGLVMRASSRSSRTAGHLATASAEPASHERQVSIDTVSVAPARRPLSSGATAGPPPSVSAPPEAHVHRGTYPNSGTSSSSTSRVGYRLEANVTQRRGTGSGTTCRLGSGQRQDVDAVGTIRTRSVGGSTCRIVHGHRPDGDDIGFNRGSGASNGSGHRSETEDASRNLQRIADQALIQLRQHHEPPNRAPSTRRTQLQISAATEALPPQQQRDDTPSRPTSARRVQHVLVNQLTQDETPSRPSSSRRRQQLRMQSRPQASRDQHRHPDETHHRGVSSRRREPGLTAHAHAQVDPEATHRLPEASRDQHRHPDETHHRGVSSRRREPALTAHAQVDTEATHRLPEASRDQHRHPDETHHRGVSSRRREPVLTAHAQVGPEATHRLPEALNFEQYEKDLRIAEFMQMVSIRGCGDLEPELATCFLEENQWDLNRAFDELCGFSGFEQMQDVSEVLEQEYRVDLEDALRESAHEAYSGGFSAPPADEVQLAMSSSVRSFSSITDAPDKCAVCLEDFGDGDSIRTLSCSHLYHVACVDQWLARSGQCPTCKSRIGA